jgi:hypothetical protein
MNIQEELETLRASESIKHANLQELARLVLAYHKAGPGGVGYSSIYVAMCELAEGVKQPEQLNRKKVAAIELALQALENVDGESGSMTVSFSDGKAISAKFDSSGKFK